jgi:SpoIID/LytB domain protein
VGSADAFRKRSYHGRHRAPNPPRATPSAALARTARAAAAITAAVVTLIGTTIAATTVSSVLAPTTALADSFVPVPSNGVFAVSGHGFGHGIGMSQYGAFGAAQQGLTVGQILSFYYPGTTQQQVGDPQIRVHLTAYDSAGITMVAPTGQPMTVTDATTGSTATGPSTMYKVTIDPTALHVFELDPTSRVWQPFTVGTSANAVGAVTLTTPGGVRMYNSDGTSRLYRGTIRIVRISPTTAAAVNYLDMQSYLYGVVPREMPDSWVLPAALEAQAVAARSYALSVETAGGNWDICDTTACQVYGGEAMVDAAGVATSVEGAHASPAVDATNGVALYYNGAPAFTQFSSSNGGEVAPGTKPYLVAKPDPYDSAALDPNANWTANLSAATLQAAYPAIGTIQGLQVISRDGDGDFGGRITSLQLVGTSGTQTVSFPFLGLKSDFWSAGGGPSQTPVILNRGTATGNLEAATSAGPGVVSVSGWSLNPAGNSVADFVDVYADGVVLGRLAANTPRADVATAIPGAGPYHGFSSTFPLSGGVHQICVHGIDGVTNPVIGCRSVTLPSGNPFGNVESVKDIGTGVQVSGWAIDPDTANPVTVHLYVDGVFAGLTTASNERDDVAAHYPGYGADHGFSTVVAAKQGTHTICAYAINIGIGTSNPALRCTSLTLNRNPKGAAALASYSGGTATITGWAVDPDTLGPVAVHVYVDGKWSGATSAALDGATQAAALYPGYGTQHAYSFTLALKPGSHQVCTYAINVGQGSTNPLLGCVTVNSGGNPIGRLESVKRTIGGWTATGWALDPDVTNPIYVDIYVDGHLKTRTVAKGNRSDVQAVYPGWGGTNGFSVLLSLMHGQHQICAFAINSGPGTTNPSLGCSTIEA